MSSLQDRDLQDLEPYFTRMPVRKAGGAAVLVAVAFGRAPLRALVRPRGPPC